MATDANLYSRLGKLEGQVEDILQNHLPHIIEDIRGNRRFVLGSLGVTMAMLSTILGVILTK